MDEQQQRITQAAQQFTDALVEGFRTTAQRGVNAQEQNAQLTQEFFYRVIEHLRTQAVDTRQMGQQLADQQQRASEAGQQLTRESVEAYTGFVNSMFSFYQRSAEQERRQV
jgi:hypothetical protein